MGEISDYYVEKNIYSCRAPKKPIQPFLHKCKDGSYVDVHGVHPRWPRMGDEHLLNTIEFLRAKATKGFSTHQKNRIVFVKGDNALSLLKIKIYLKEAKKRNI